VCRDAEVVEEAADAALDFVADGEDVVDGLSCAVVQGSGQGTCKTHIEMILKL
jgi:hypothetical protein